MAVIDSVSQTLVNVLSPRLDAMAPGPGPFAQLHNLTANVPDTPPRVTITLFDVAEDPSARNRPRVRQDLAGDIRIRKPDIALHLRYLLTAWSQSIATEQAMLSVTLQTFYDDSILDGPQLAGTLAGTDVALKINLSQLSVEDRTHVWQSLQRPYKLSLIYDVRVVPLPSLTDESLTPVSRRSLQFGEPVV
jgi:hypothetical protein